MAIDLVFEASMALRIGSRHAVELQGRAAGSRSCHVPKYGELFRGDPLAGFYYVESLTSELAQKAWALIEEMEAMGGMTKAVASGLPKRMIEEVAARRQAAVDMGEKVIVGVKCYRLESEDWIDSRDFDNIVSADDLIDEGAIRHKIVEVPAATHQQGVADGALEMAMAAFDRAVLMCDALVVASGRHAGMDAELLAALREIGLSAYYQDWNRATCQDLRRLAPQ